MYTYKLALLVVCNIAVTLATGGTSYASFHSPHQGKYHYGVLHHHFPSHGGLGYGYGGGAGYGFGGGSGYGFGGGHLLDGGHGGTSYANYNLKSYGSYPVLGHSDHSGYGGLGGEEHDFGSYADGFGHGLGH